jgi:hypothetical protein
MDAETSATVIRRIEAAEASQGVAVDRNHAYAIGTKTIGKYDKETGKKVGSWKSSTGDGILHLDSGVIIEDKLYAGHSNWPRIPMNSSIEIWDAKTLKYMDRIQLGEAHGSCTWIDRHDGAWWICFAHYKGRGGYADRGPEATTLAKYDDRFKELGRWTFPKEVVSRFGSYSCSGGSWGPDGLLYCSGHDRPELYALRVPARGDVLELVKTVKVDSRGQGVAWDRSAGDVLVTIKRKEKQIVFSRFDMPTAKPAH